MEDPRPDEPVFATGVDTGGEFRFIMDGGNADEVRKLLEQGASANTKADHDQYLPLHYALVKRRDDMVEALPDPHPPIPERSQQRPRAAIVGAGVAGAICAKTIRDYFKIDVVVFESHDQVGGRLGSCERGGIPFTAGSSYFCAKGPHLKPYIKTLLEEAAISEWKPRVGVVGKSAITSGDYVGFIPSINTQEEEINIEAWIENRPHTGAPCLAKEPCK